MRNHERVVAAASAVLAEKGAEAGIPEIAARAGVGKGTVYRCFETKEHLVAAVLAERVRGWTETVADGRRARRTRGRRSASCWGTWPRASPATARSRRASPTRPALPELLEAKAAMYVELDRLMDRAKEQGRMRADVTSEDLRVLFGGITRALRAEGTRDPADWRRYAALVADAFRAA